MVQIIDMGLAVSAVVLSDPNKSYILINDNVGIMIDDAERTTVLETLKPIVDRYQAAQEAAQKENT